jgi:hypothetical protein
MVGEFGLSEDQPGALKFLDDVLEMYDKVTSGWFYWSYDRGSWGLQNEAGAEHRKADVLVRPYPQKIAGAQPRYSWQPQQRAFSLSFNTAEAFDSSLTTEVYLPPRAWPDGWRLINHGVDISHTYDPEGQLLSIHPQQPGEISITIESEKARQQYG